MNTAIKHSSCHPNTPRERNLSVSQSWQIESIQENIKMIVWGIGTAIEEMEKWKEKLLEKQLENQRKIEEIALACEHSGSDELVPFAKLIRETGNVNVKNLKGLTILMKAIQCDCPEIINLLLASPEIKVNEKDMSGFTALLMAVEGGYTKVTKLLLARPEVQVNELSKGQFTALISAAYSSHVDITRLLLADPRLNLQTHDQWKNAFKDAQIPAIKALIKEAMRKQGIES
jgi:ankyrin repeat protein